MDTALLLRAKRGDTQALSDLYARYAPQLLRYITTRMGDPAQAIAVDASTDTPFRDETAAKPTILVVDDDDINRTVVVRNLKRLGHAAAVAENGRQALALMRRQSFDLVLLDIMMPEMNGYQMLEQLRIDPALRHIPAVVISGIEDVSSVIRCIELGAEDYLFKPCDPVLLKARVEACLEKKRLRDQEHAYITQLQQEREKSERLLLNILPQPIAEQLKHDSGVVAESYDNVTVLFADIVDFTSFASRVSPSALVNTLNSIFLRFDGLAERYGLEKIKTIGDAYMVVGGLPSSRADHAEAIAEMALAMQASIADISARKGEEFVLRIGVSSGPAIAGVIGAKKFTYDLWGDTVNTASRMESLGLPGRIQVCPATYERLRHRYIFDERGEIYVKGKGAMTTYFLIGCSRMGRDAL
jgi:class 3 adenylate cyclase